MKSLCLLLLCLSLPAWATPITNFQLSNVGSALETGNNFAALWSSDPSPNFSYLLDITSNGSLTNFNSGGFSLRDGSTYLYATTPNAELSGSLLSGTFSGKEIVRLGAGNWVYWAVSGRFQQSVDFKAADGTGQIQITSSTFEGKYPVVPEPGTVYLLGAGLVSAVWRRSRAIRG